MSAEEGQSPPDDPLQVPLDAPLHDETVIESSILRLPNLKPRTAPTPKRSPLPLQWVAAGSIALLLAALAGAYWSQRLERLEQQRQAFLNLCRADPEAALNARTSLPLEIAERPEVVEALLGLEARVLRARAHGQASELLAGRGQDPSLEARLDRCQRAAASHPTWGEAALALLDARWGAFRADGDVLVARAPSLLATIEKGIAGPDAAAAFVGRAALRLALDPSGPDGRRARSDLEAASQVDPEGAWGHMARGWRQRLLGQATAAEAHLDHALEKRPHLLRALLLRGRLRLERDDLNSAAHDAQAAQQADSLSAEAWVLGARVRVARKEASAAVDSDLARAAALAPGLARLHLARAELARGAGNLQAARRAALSALAGDAHLAAAYTLLADIADQDGHPETARRHADLALRHGQAARALRLRARLRLAARDVGGAMRDLRAALERSPKDLESARRLAALYLRHGDPRAARALVERLARLLPGQVAPFVMLGEAHLRSSPPDPQAALEALSEALALEPDHTAARLRRAQAYLLVKRSMPALDDLRAIQPSALPPGLRSYWLGQALEVAGEIQEARAAYEDCVATSPPDTSHRRRAGLRIKALRSP